MLLYQQIILLQMFHFNNKCYTTSNVRICDGPGLLEIVLVSTHLISTAVLSEAFLYYETSQITTQLVEEQQNLVAEDLDHIAHLQLVGID